MTDILQYCPYPPRDGQVDILHAAAQGWDRHGVQVIVGPVAIGKSLIAVTLADYAASLGLRAAIITPNNVLVDQYAESHPNFPVIHKRARYKAERQYQAARATAHRSPTILSNFYTYAANRLQRDVLIIDEAHNVINMLQDRWASRLWHRDWHFPEDMTSVEDFVSWAEGVRSDKLDKIVKEVVRDGSYTLQSTEELWRGKMQPVLKLIPLTVRGRKPWLWPSAVRKVILLSATISDLEVYELDLDGRRVNYIEADSPIPAANRPVYIDPVVNMAYANRSHALGILAERLHRDLLSRQGKGVIHATYEVAARLRSKLSSSRLIWHTNADKQQRYQEWRSSPPSAGKVLVASGMSEGVDLAHEAARWQVICQVPYPNLADPGIAHKAAENPRWFRWQAVKQLMQTIGRVCRAPDDYGETWIYDSQFARLYKDSEDMWPQHVLNSFSFKRPAASLVTSNIQQILV